MNDRTLTEYEQQRITERMAEYLSFYDGGQDEPWHYLAAAGALLGIVNEYLISDPQEHA